MINIVKHKGGRPPKDKYNVDFMVKKVDEYIESRKKSVPILKECCLLNDWDYVYVMQLRHKHEELSKSIRIILDWKEIKLEQGALTGELDKTMAIFSLKQLGWRDRQEVDVDVSKLNNILKAVEDVD